MTAPPLVGCVVWSYDYDYIIKFNQFNVCEFESKVRPRTFGCVAMRGVVYF